jgi:DNA-binding NarL/FixJ family response regulator
LRCLIVDDHSFTRLGIRRILQESYPEATFVEVGSCAEALAALRETEFGLATLDLSLPDGSGLDLLKDLRGRYPRLPILVVTMHSQLHYVRRAMQSGASGYLAKDRAPEDLALATMRALAGKVDPVFPKHSDPLDSLSDREFEVLRGLVHGHTVGELAQQLTLSVKTISTYRTRLMEKLELETQADLLSFGRAHLP